MSVVFFSADELGNAAAFLAASRWSTERQTAEIVAALAAYSVGNAWAYSRQYGQSTEPVSAEEIASATNPRRFNREQAKGTLRLLTYNGATNAGREMNLPGYFEAVATLMSLALARVLEEQEARAER